MRIWGCGPVGRDVKKGNVPFSGVMALKYLYQINFYSVDNNMLIGIN